MYIISKNLSNYGILMPKDWIFKINLAREYITVASYTIENKLNRADFYEKKIKVINDERFDVKFADSYSSRMFFIT